MAQPAASLEWPNRRPVVDAENQARQSHYEDKEDYNLGHLDLDRQGILLGSPVFGFPVTRCMAYWQIRPPTRLGQGSGSGAGITLLT